MTQDPLKDAWNKADSTRHQPAAIQAMINKGSHPVMSSIRRQLLFEAGCYLLFLVVFYDFFDGHTRPFYLNAILVAAVGCMLVHNITGYLLTAVPLKGSNLLESLQQQLRKLRQYAKVSVCTRLLGVAGLLLYFSMQIRWTTGKYWLVAGGLAVVAVQLVLLWQIWQGRIRKVSNTIAALNS